MGIVVVGRAPRSGGGLVVDTISKSRYTSEVIKASGLLLETKTLLAHWDDRLSVVDNLGRAMQDNIFGKTSRSRVQDVLEVFRHRYLEDPSRFRALRALAEAHVPAEILHPIAYFFCAQSDRLIHDAVTEIVYPMREQGHTEVTVNDIEERLSDWVQQGRTMGKWSGATTRRVAEGLLATLRDFGILRGNRTKVIRPMNLPAAAFALIAFDLRRNGASGGRLVSDPEWKLFLLRAMEVERLFIEAHQQRLLEFYAAGGIVRVDFPANTIEEYAHVVAR
jgi:AcrR family transcriptional regulator